MGIIDWVMDEESLLTFVQTCRRQVSSDLLLLMMVCQRMRYF